MGDVLEAEAAIDAVEDREEKEPHFDGSTQWNFTKGEVNDLMVEIRRWVNWRVRNPKA